MEMNTVYKAGIYDPIRPSSEVMIEALKRWVVHGSIIKQRLEQRILLVGKQVSLKKNILKKEEQFQKEFNNGSHLAAKTNYSHLPIFHLFAEF